MEQYINKSAVVTEIKRILSAFENSDAPVDRLRASILIRLLSFLDTLKVKEVDFDKEYVYKDAFIEKACSWLKSHYRDYMHNPTGKKVRSILRR